ncbi:MAG: WXG100 family type VII secretion target [Micrococcales bacterium]|nr:WXG100 family type VII secretion target [Micrococcales bacterium]
MAAGTQGAEAGALQKGQDAVVAARGSIASRLTNVRNEVEQLRAYWTGEAAVSFDAMMRQFDENATRVNNALNNLADGLGATATDQARNLEEQQATISNLAAGMA